MGFVQWKKTRAEKKAQKEQVTALCLGGGGARGFAHIGAIKAFEEMGLHFDMVVGTSVGSLVGALYAAGVSSQKMLEYGEVFSLRDIHNGVLLTPNDPAKIANVITNILGDTKIEELRTRFAAVAVDLVSAKQVVLDHGRVSTAVSASCAVPILFRPVDYNGMHLVDGGLLNNIPADVCRMLGATRVITVDVNPTRGSGTSGKGIFDMLKGTMGIVMANASVEGLRHSDVVIAPDTGAYSSARKRGYEEMVELGYTAAKATLQRG